MNKKTYVIAGNYHQFISYLKDKSNQIYVQDKIQLFGIHKPDVILIGTYCLRQDWIELKELLQIIEANIIYGK